MTAVSGSQPGSSGGGTSETAIAGSRARKTAARANMVRASSRRVVLTIRPGTKLAIDRRSEVDIYRERWRVEHAAMNKPLAWIAGTIGCAALVGEASGAPASEQCCAVMELRQYVTKPGRRDDLIALVDRHFLEGQEAHAMRIVGQFRNPQAPDR